jgi:hypothetical protein
VRRVFWLALGLGAGATSAFLAARWVRRQAQAIAPANLARQASQGVQDLGALAAQTMEDFRQGMAEKEAEVRASLSKD